MYIEDFVLRDTGVNETDSLCLADKKKRYQFLKNYGLLNRASLKNENITCILKK